jgi:hypothetical protein
MKQLGFDFGINLSQDLANFIGALFSLHTKGPWSVVRRQLQKLLFYPILEKVLNGSIWALDIRRL